MRIGRCYLHLSMLMVAMVAVLTSTYAHGRHRMVAVITSAYSHGRHRMVAADVNTATIRWRP
jgi:hypothetical protein